MERGAIWRRIRRGLCCLLGAVMLAQIAFSFIWMAENINAVPCFGDSTEYINLSESMSLDEYRPVLYPLLLRGLRQAFGEGFHIPLYLLQTILSVFSLSAAAYALDRVGRNRKKQGRAWKNVLMWVYTGLYLNAIPMITFMNFTVLTDSLANSLLVLFLAMAVLVIYEKPTVPRGVCMALAMAGQSLLRADRFYSGLLLLACLLIVGLIRNRQGRKALLIGFAGILVINMAIVLPVRAVTQVKGRNGRVETNLSFVLLDRVVWPNMAANYEYFPEEIKANISLEEAQSFDSHNNKVMYELAPGLEAKVGKEKAAEYYRTMAGIVWEHQSGKVIRDIADDTLSLAAAPLTHYLAVHEMRGHTNIPWNIHCLSTVTPERTKQYDDAGLLILLVCLMIWLLILIPDLILNGRSRQHPMGVFLIAGAIICLWFSLGDGAPPNDRYALIIYTFYGLLPVSLAWFRPRKTAGN